MSAAPTGLALVLSGSSPHSPSAANANTTMTSPNNKIPALLPPGFIGTPSTSPIAKMAKRIGDIE